VREFLRRHGRGDARVEPLAGDASFRRYLRATPAEGAPEVVMDAPPEHGEDVAPFVAVAGLLARSGLRPPAVLAADEPLGLLLLEDLGDLTYERALAAGASEAALYDAAIDVLARLHRHRPPDWLPRYDDEAFAAEHALFTDWYLPAVGRPVDAADRDAFLAEWRSLLPLARAVPEVVVMRDYHTRNLMWLPAAHGPARVGVLDFQDAVAGPCTYDMVSLLGDAYRDVPGRVRRRAVARHLAALDEVDPAAYELSLTILGAQRRFKVIGTFTRLAHRDGKPAYLASIPRVWRGLDEALAHPELGALRATVDRWLPGGRRPVPPPAPAPGMGALPPAGPHPRLRPR
jgi:aminoglycoside/choline kinase family phosphotransferase